MTKSITEEAKVLLTLRLRGECTANDLRYYADTLNASAVIRKLKGKGIPIVGAWRERKGKRVRAWHIQKPEAPPQPEAQTQTEEPKTDNAKHMKKETGQARVLRVLEEHGECSARVLLEYEPDVAPYQAVRELKKHGHPIASEWREIGGKRTRVYFIQNGTAQASTDDNDKPECDE